MLFLLMDMVETPEEKRKTEALFNTKDYPTMSLPKF